MLPKHSKINKYKIKLKKNKQLPFELIYYLKLIKLEIFKTYIKINRANGFTIQSNLPASVFIFFV